LPGFVVDTARSVTFTWESRGAAALYRLEIETGSGAPLLSALVPGSGAGYRAPPWLAARAPERKLRWRVIATDLGGRMLARSAWRGLAVASPTVETAK
jgi:hypothetical protein